MRKISVLMTCMFLLLMCVGCGCKHQWLDATCTKPKMCAKCEKTEGEPLGHVWADATCTEPQTCYNCGQKQGKTLEHTVANYEVVSEPTCINDGLEAGMCLTCGNQQTRIIKAIGHNYQETKRVESTCQKVGYYQVTCQNCKDVITTELEAVDHDYSDWKVTKTATDSASGTQERVCSMCRHKETRSYELTEDEKRAYRASKGIVSGKTESNKAAELTVNSVSQRNSIGSSFYNERSKYGVLFVVSFTYKNIDTEADFLSYSDFMLILDDYKYEPSWDAIWAGIVGNGNYLSSENVNPNCALKMSIIFDIPKEVATNPDLKLRVSSGGLFDGYVTVNIY